MLNKFDERFSHEQLSDILQILVSGQRLEVRKMEGRVGLVFARDIGDFILIIVGLAKCLVGFVQESRSGLLASCIWNR